jgi:hypothetical protein
MDRGGAMKREGILHMNVLKWFRGILVVHVLGVFTQAAFAGLMLGGNDLAVNLHGLTGRLLVPLALIQLSVSVVMRVKRRCPTWVIVANLAILAAEVVEVTVGYGHNMAIHVPLGVAIFGGLLRQLFWSVREASVTSELRI